jgi:DNA repair exonuclease SbcCD ATPase subunit
MIEEVREYLKKIDQIVDSEARRLNDQIDEMKDDLKEFKNNRDNISSFNKELEDLSIQVDELKYEANQQKKIITKLEHFENKCSEQDELIKKLTQEQAGYIFTIQVISKWIPSQKENIDVLVALSSALNHEATFEKLQEKTTIPSVTLKNRIIPLLKDSQLVSIDKKKVRLTIDNK